jgi:hypothetical protein
MKRIHLWGAGIGAGVLAVTAAASPVAFAENHPGGGSAGAKSASTGYHVSYAPVRKGHWGERRCHYPFNKTPDLDATATKVGKQIVVSGKLSINGCTYAGITVTLVDGVKKTALTKADGTFIFEPVTPKGGRHGKTEKLAVVTDYNETYGLYPAMTRIELTNDARFEHGYSHH